MLSSLVLPFDFSNFAVVAASRLETNVYCSSMHMRAGNDHRCDRWSVHVHFNQFPRFIFLFYLYKFFFCLRFRSLELRFKFQRALRPKKEEAISRRGPANCHSRGQLLMAPHPLGHPEHGKSLLLLLCHYARF